MVININILQHAISNLPKPEFEGERCKIELPDRVQELNRERVTNDPEGVEEPKGQILILTAMTFCRSKHDCWFEWEIEI